MRTTAKTDAGSTLMTYAELASRIEAISSKDDLLGNHEVFEALARLEGRDRFAAEDALLAKGEEYHCKGRVGDKMKSYREAERRRQKAEDRSLVAAKSMSMCILDFEPGRLESERTYPTLSGGTSWAGNEDGVYYMGADVPQLIIHHPIMPVKKLVNQETRTTYVTIAFRRYGRWTEMTLPKTTLAKTSDIVGLSAYDVDVNSETAKALVRYMTDVEVINERIIPSFESTEKFGWKNGGTSFVPYDPSPIFDAKDRFKGLCEAFEARGKLEAWVEAVKKVRPGVSIVPRVALAASFASVLVGRLNLLPFIVDTWGTTEGGKTVTLMVAASVWASPNEHQYIMSYKRTGTSQEVLCDVLNNLPVFLDDSSDMDAAFKASIETFVYDLCSGKGKSRSNKSLGLNREHSWRNCVITNGERPLSEKVSQGGAVNRILELECESRLYGDGDIQDVLDVITQNYGLAGRVFVNRLKEISADKLRQEYERIFRTLDEGTMQKQRQAVACILLADKLATEWIFRDGQRLYASDLRKILTNPAEVSEGARAYAWLMDMLLIKEQHFNPMQVSADQWGVIDRDARVARFYKQALSDLLAQGGFSLKAFVSWAQKEGLLEVNESGNTFTKVCRIKVGEGNAVVTKSVRMVCVKIQTNVEVSDAN